MPECPEERERLSFEKAVRLFKEWGFLVEPGPLEGEVTLITEGPGYRNYCVYEAAILPQIAAEILLVRRRRAASPSDGRQDGKAAPVRRFELTYN